jgi:homoserine O-succinyltransferase/O-acetyltransferase
MPLVVESVSGSVVWAGERLYISDGGFAGVDASAPSIHLALINNMPDVALKDTESQFFELLNAASENLLVRLKLLSLSQIPRGDLIQKRLSELYFEGECLWNTRLDALIVTGMEPCHSDLRHEPYWHSLVEVLEWAKENTVSTILSCLAAHAGVLHSDGIVRNPLSDKQFGVFEVGKVNQHALTSATDETLRFPHSRWNEVRGGALTWSGYSILTQSAEAGVDLFVKRIRKSLFIHFQGHPEYGTWTLLKEYRRDIRRFLKRERQNYPLMPRDYFDAASIELLTDYQNEALSNRSVDLLARFPEVLLAGSIRNTWGLTARRVYGNWLQYLLSRKTETLTLAASAAAHANDVAVSSKIN